MIDGWRPSTIMLFMLSKGLLLFTRRPHFIFFKFEFLSVFRLRYLFFPQKNIKMKLFIYLWMRFRAIRFWLFFHYMFYAWIKRCYCWKDYFRFKNWSLLLLIYFKQIILKRTNLLSQDYANNGIDLIIVCNLFPTYWFITWYIFACCNL